jgi:hypothetical protein
MTEKQVHPPAGWYPDPGGQGRRYWDGAQWSQVAAPARRMSRARRVWLVAVPAAIIAVICVGLPVAFFVSMAGPSQGDLRKAADAVAIPAEFTLVDEYWIGNRICLDDCFHLYRRYSSPSSKQETYQIFAAALQKAGFQCTSFCEGFDGAGHSLYTTWLRSGEQTINLVVFSTADPAGAGLSLREPLDPARQVHADVQVS